MFSPKSYEDRPLSQNKLLRFYHHSSSKHKEQPPPLFKSRLLTSETQLRTHTYLPSPKNRIVSKSIMVHQADRPSSTVNRKKHPQSGFAFFDNIDEFRGNTAARKQRGSRIFSNKMASTENNSGNVSLYETPMDYNKILSGYGSISLKNPINEEDVGEKLKSKHEKISKIREKVKKELVFDKLRVGTSLDKDVQVFLTVLQSHHDRNLEKFLLLPNVEVEAFEKFLDLESFTLKLLKVFHENFEKLSKEFTNLREKHDTLESNYSSFCLKNQEFLKKQVDRISEQNRKDFSRLKLNLDKYESVSTLENIRLEKELLELQKGLEGRIDVKELNEAFESFKAMSQNRLQQKEVSIRNKEELLNKYVYQLNTTKSALLKLEREHKSLQKENLDLKEEVLTLKEKLEDSNERKRRLQEICLMQKEDTEGYYERNHRLLKSISILNEKLAETKKKIGGNLDSIGLVSSVEAFHRELESLEGINSFMTHKFARILSKKNFSNDDFDSIQKLESPHKSSFGMNQSRVVEFEDVLGQISLPSMQYFKPSFSSFVESFYGANQRKLETEGMETKISLHFMATLRGIFDSKYNEFLYYTDYKSYSRFPEFVYSWLTTFELCEETKQIKEVGLEKSADPNQIILHFLSNLYHPLSLKLWECQNFKDFLEEKSSSDELFFYLHCRFLLNKGPTLQREGAAFSYVHFVLFYWAEAIVDLVLKQFDEESKGFVKARLREKAKGKNKKLLIDSSFVLKVLLEYYRLERKQKFMNIRDLFRVLSLKKTSNNLNGSAVSKKTPIITDFQCFKIILEKIHGKTTELEKAEFFRECYQIGNGEITPEIAFAVLTESNFFICSLKLRSIMNLGPNKNNLPKGHVHRGIYTDKLETLNEKIRQDEKMSGFLAGAKKTLSELGIERLCSYYDFYARLFSEKHKFLDLAEFCGRSPEFALCLLGNVINSIRGLKMLHGHLFEEEIKLEREWGVFNSNMGAIEDRANQEKIKYFEKNAKIKRIQAFMRKRVSKCGLLESCQVSTDEICENQNKLLDVLNKIYEELDDIRKDNGMEKDKELAEQLDKINNYKKRLGFINSQMDKIQSRVEKIEKKYLKYHNIIQNIQDSSLQDQIKK